MGEAYNISHRSAINGNRQTLILTQQKACETGTEMGAQRFRTSLDSKPFHTKLYSPRWPHIPERHTPEKRVDVERLRMEIYFRSPHRRHNMIHRRDGCPQYSARKLTPTLSPHVRTDALARVSTVRHNTVCLSYYYVCNSTLYCGYKYNEPGPLFRSSRVGLRYFKYKEQR